MMLYTAVDINTIWNKGCLVRVLKAALWLSAVIFWPNQTVPPVLTLAFTHLVMISTLLMIIYHKLNMEVFGQKYCDLTL